MIFKLVDYFEYRFFLYFSNIPNHRHFDFRMRTITNSVSVILAVLFVYLSIKENGLFKFHPSLMGISYFGCMFQAIYIFSIDESTYARLLTRRKQILVHSILQMGTISCSTLAFLAIYYNKQQRNKPHFTTWHGLLGLIAFGWSLAQSFTGLFLTIFQRYIRSFGLTYGQLRIYHATSGVLLFTFSCFVIVLSLASNWFQNQVPTNRILSSIIFYLLTSSILFLAHKSVEQVKNRYVKRKLNTQ